MGPETKILEIGVAGLFTGQMSDTQPNLT